MFNDVYVSHIKEHNVDYDHSYLNEFDFLNAVYFSHEYFYHIPGTLNQKKHCLLMHPLITAIGVENQNWFGFPMKFFVDCTVKDTLHLNYLHFIWFEALRKEWQVSAVTL